MQPYKNLSRTSGITHYDCGDDYIDLAFKGGKVYRYDYDKPGKVHVEKMKELAKSGANLTTYLNQHVRENFAARLK